MSHKVHFNEHAPKKNTFRDMEKPFSALCSSPLPLWVTGNHKLVTCRFCMRLIDLEQEKKNDF